MSKSLLIIGVGYVGQKLATMATNAGWNVTGITKSGEGTTLKGDVGNPESVKTLRHTFTTPPHVIIHCASSGRGGAPAYRHVFLQGIKNLQEHFPESQLLFVSSTSVYAQTNGETVTETSPSNPTRETGKILCETEKTVLTKQGLVARLAGIYGPGRSMLLKKLLSGDALIEEDGRRFLNHIHRDDAASALLFLAERATQEQGEIFNISDNATHTQKKTYQTLCQEFNLPLPSVGDIDLNRKRGWTHKKVSNTKLVERGWTPSYPDFLKIAHKIKLSLQT